MFRTAALTAATFAAAALPLLAASAHADADDCLVALQQNGHSVTEQTAAACGSGQTDLGACLVALNEEGVENRLAVAACLEPKRT